MNTPQITSLDPLYSTCSAILNAITTQAPLIHCLTNEVSSNFMANVLLAIGASPAMVVDPAEVVLFTPQAKALVINIGTLTEYQYKAMDTATKLAQSHHIPWVLDPLSAGLSNRLTVLRHLVTHSPTVIRGNAGEIQLLYTALNTQDKHISSVKQSPAGDHNSYGVTGTESQLDWQAARYPAIALAKTLKCVVAVSGEMDFVTDGKIGMTIAGGDKWMTKVTAVGCTLNACIAAALAVTKDHLNAVVAVMSMYGAIGTRLGQSKLGLGSLAVNFLDELTHFQLDAGQFSQQITRYDLTSNTQWSNASVRR